MTKSQNKLTRFWQELKRRKVIRVILVYATTSFFLLQIVDLVLEPLHLPQWVMTFLVVLLLVGFPIAIIFSWIFDITPQGVEITKSEDDEVEKESPGIFSRRYVVLDAIIGVLLVAVIILAYPKVFKAGSSSDLTPELDKSIAVLPFIDDSPNEGNAYIINGLMEEILNNLQKIKDLDVLSRTTSEKYRDSKLSISEIAEELNVNYILEGSGQKVGSRIKIMLQLIEAKTDKHLWSNPYQKEVNDENIFELQEEVALSVAAKLKAIITPEEKERIVKAPTDNLTAYDYFLKGSEMLFNAKGNADLKEAIRYSEKALEHDSEFASAYALRAGCYYVLDILGGKKKYSAEINYNADKALLYDPELDISLIAKAMFYRTQGENELAITYLEKALLYNPNSYLALKELCYIYSMNSLKTEEFIVCAIKAIRLDIPTGTNFDKSWDYIALSRAFHNSGFFKESEMYINKMLEVNSDTVAAMYEKGKLLSNLSEDKEQAIKLFTEVYSRDSTRTSTLRDLFLTHYWNRDFTEAHKYGNKLIEKRKANNTGLSVMDNGRFGFILSKIGMNKESEEYFRRYREIVERNKMIEKNRLMVGVYTLEGDQESAIEQMKIFSQHDSYLHWMIRVFKEDPIYDTIRDLPEFKQILKEMETKFWANHERIKASLTEKGLLPIKM